MSDTEAKDMDEQSPILNELDEHEQKHAYLINEPSQEEDEETIRQITDGLEKTSFPDTDTGERSRSHNEKTGQKTIEQWLTKDNLVVYPVWIGNLPRETSVPDLRRFLEAEIGRVLISVHISPKRNSNERTYAFLNLPTAEKQILAVTLLDGTTFHGEKLIVRSKRPSKFPQSFFGSSPISDHFKHFRDCVVPAILAAPTVNLNVHAVKRIMEEHSVGLDHLPNRVWCVQCTLTPNCHRTYCSFYHNQEERELGRIISILAAQNCNESGDAPSSFDISPAETGDMLKRPVPVSRHTLLIEGLPKSVSTQKLTEMFEVFGEIDHVIVNPNNTCFLRMKRSQDARKIVHLLNMNNSGIQIQFAPYAANPQLLGVLRSVAKRNKMTESMQRSSGAGGSGGDHSRSYRSRGGQNRLNLGDQTHSYSMDSVDTDVNGAPPLMNTASADTLPSGGYAGHPTGGSGRHGPSGLSLRNSHSVPPLRGGAGDAGATMGYDPGMPHAPPPPAAIFKEDDIRYMRSSGYPHTASTPASTGYEYMDDRASMMTPDYQRYMMNSMGYDWGSAGMHNYYATPSYGYHYPYRNPGLPQLSHMSASDPVGYQTGHGGFSTTPGYQAHQAHHPGYQHEQSSRHRHRRRHLDPHSHSSHDYPVQRGVEAGAPRSSHPIQSVSSSSKKPRADAPIHDILDDIPGI